MEPKFQDKARGMLVGLAVGDALGAPVEFLPEPSDVYIKEMGDKIEYFHKNYRAPEGVWTDDTEMALCIADSLLTNGGYDSYDIMRRFTSWANEGYWTYDGKPAADIGYQTQRAIEDFRRYPVIFGNDTTNSAGNGAIMRLAPVIIANKDIEPAVSMAVLSCRETHNSIAAEATTALFAAALYSVLHGSSKDDVASNCSRWLPGEEYSQFWRENTDSLVGRALEKDGEKFCNLGGYIVDTFAISLWGLMHFDNFKDGMMAVIRLGGDTDTNAACYGQLAGAYYGYQAIPEEWRKNVYLADELVEIANNLLKMPKCPVLKTRFEDDKYFKEENE